MDEQPPAATPPIEVQRLPHTEVLAMVAGQQRAMHAVCHACYGCSDEAAPASATFLASEPGGSVLGYAYIGPGDQPGDRRIALSVLPECQHGPVVVQLLEALAEAARTGNGERVVTVVDAPGTRPYAAFHEAGMPVKSSMQYGGVSELILGLD
jgi:hypothetical protein